MRVAIADDSALFRRGLANLLTAVGITVICQARDAEMLTAFVAVDPPDAVVLDIRMPPGFSDEGLRAAADLRRRHPGIGVLVLSTYNETAYAMRLLADGGEGVGYLLKDRVEDVDALRDALERVVDGQSVVDPDIVTRLVRHRARARPIDSLTERERAVLHQMAQGRSNVGVGQVLAMSARTVEAHVAGVFAKLGLPPDADDNRRVLAVLSWLRSGTPAE